MAKRDANDSGFCSKDRNAKCRRTATSVEELKSVELPLYFAREHEADILKALEVIETDLKLGEHIRWDMLLPVVRGMRVNRETAWDCLNLLRELFSLFDRHKCRGAAVMSAVFYALLYLTTDIRYGKIKCQTTELSEIIDMPYGTETKLERRRDLAGEAAKTGQLNHLKQLLKCGFEVRPPYVDLDSRCFEIEMLIYFWANARGVLHIDGNEEERNLQLHLQSVMKSESNKRIHLVIRVLQMVCNTQVRNRPKFTEVLAECYRLLFASIPEAYVTSVEVKVFLEKYLPRAYFMLIPDIIEAFETFLPKLAEIPHPRSLQHLCRIRVRGSLRRNLNFPHGVSSLPLPAMLKKYIMLNDDDDSTELIEIYKHIIHIEPYVSDYINNKGPWKHDVIRSFVEKL